MCFWKWLMFEPVDWVKTTPSGMCVCVCRRGGASSNPLGARTEQKNQRKSKFSLWVGHPPSLALWCWTSGSQVLRSGLQDITSFPHSPACRGPAVGLLSLHSRLSLSLKIHLFLEISERPMGSVSLEENLQWRLWTQRCRGHGCQHLR